jgi:FtsP/CotA-like multicopper oxidase with cupredoxin domain
MMSINRQLPGPPIEVCKHDLIVVDVINQIDGNSVTIHWHGFSQQKFPFMDGVPYVTQCPIHFGSTFRYTFEALQTGTFFYHSHVGHQKANGIYGALIVREKENEKLFDFDLSEHVLVLSDWTNELTEDLFPGLLNRLSYPTSFLINGRGRFFNKNTKNFTKSPISVFHVDEGNRYKFRLIGASSNVCPLEIQIEDHHFTIIAADSTEVKPFTADKLCITSGERFEIVINANVKTRKDLFWIRVSTFTPCADNNDVEEFAALKYHRKGESDKTRENLMFVESENLPKAESFVSEIVS